MPPKKNAKGAKGGKGGKEEPTDEIPDDPTVLRLPTKQPPAPINVAVLQNSIVPPVPLYPEWSESEVLATYSRADDADQESSDDAATDSNPPPFEGTFVDHTIDLDNFLPPSLSAKKLQWLRPIDAIDLPFWQFKEGEVRRTGLPEFELCVVDLEVPPTDEEVAQSTAAKESHAKACAAAEEAGEEAPAPPSSPLAKPLPREMLRPLVSDEGYASRFASVFEVINSVGRSYAAKKLSESPPPPTPEEEEAAAAEKARIKAEEEAAAAAKSKKGKKGAAIEEEKEKEPEGSPEDPEHPLPSGQFLWECIYPKSTDGTTPLYNRDGRYSIKMFVDGR